MKKILLSAVALLAFGYANAQDGVRFGAKAGVDFASVKVDLGPLGEVTGTETGFFVGAFVEIPVSESFSVQPEVLYVAITDANMLNVPVHGKWEFTEDFHALVGPSFNYLLDAEEDEFKVNLDLGASYDITEDFDVSAKYSLGFGDVALSGAFFGVGYKF